MRLTIILILCPVIANAVFWKTCGETFCNRIRNVPQRPYEVDFSSVQITDGVLTGSLRMISIPGPIPTGNDPIFTLTAQADSIFHLVITKATPVVPRFRADKAIDASGLQLLPLEMKDQITNTLTVTSGSLKALIHRKPFKIEFYNDDQIVSIANSENHFVFEDEVGKSAVAMDVTFPGAHVAYGLPEHADRLALSDTAGKDHGEPYRHFNVDYGRYAVWSRESLYGTIPVLYAHATTHSSGAFWLNAAETWVDIKLAPKQVGAKFMSESGVVDVFFMMGPTLARTVKQYARITGVAPLPPYFALGYHQSRYSYMSQDEVKSVVRDFDENNFPVDVMWLDIDYTDGKRYFTWHPLYFSDPVELLANLSSTNRKLVAIIDPHIKVDPNYFLHKEATAKNYYIRNKDQTNYEGDCWPGLSSYLDFLNPEAFNYYASLYNTSHFQHKNIHVWNDMNEPAVFNDNMPEHQKSVPGESLHYGDFKHLDVHNIYGLYQVMATRHGMLSREVKVRPFILTRSHFAGVQRYAAIWTGDNAATWEYLEVSLPMCLTEALAGVSLCGADVGGFIDVPDNELYQRWYQAAAWLPFFRGHSATDVPNREPYLYPGDVQDRMRRAIQQRYAHLPVWYTQFREHELTGEPVIRPITYHYPSEADALSLDNQLLLGKDILVAPVLKPGVIMKGVYLPGGKSQIWYNIDEDYKIYRGTGQHVLTVSLNSVPVFYRGGSIITRKNQPRKTSVDTHQDPYTMYICLNDDDEAKGTLYVDDYETFDYQTKKYLYVGLTFVDNTLFSDKLQADADYANAAPLSQVIILKPPEGTASATLFEGDNTEGTELKLLSSDDGNVLEIMGFTVSLQNKFKIVLS